MIFTIILAVLLIIAIIMCKVTGEEHYGGIALLCGIIFFASMFTKWNSAYIYRAHHIAVQETQIIYDECRDRNSLMDNNITLKVLSLNKEVARKKERNTSVFGWWIDDGYDTLNLVR
jgi:hypothetical protein